jgi:tRNA(fMet)-specific endonuclease VapC
VALLGGDAALQERLAQAEEVFIASVVLGELYFGARKSGRVEESLSQIDAFATSNVVLGCDTATARLYGVMKNQLREKGRPIPENDIWIAAIARQHDLILVTRDHHFDEVQDLKRERW